MSSTPERLTGEFGHDIVKVERDTLTESNVAGHLRGEVGRSFHERN